jgi:hypothetical protein
MKKDKKRKKQKSTISVREKLQLVPRVVVMTAHAILASFLGGFPMLA